MRDRHGRSIALADELLEAAYGEMVLGTTKSVRYANELLGRSFALGVDYRLMAAFWVAVAIDHAQNGRYDAAQTALRSRTTRTTQLYATLLDNYCRAVGLFIGGLQHGSHDYWRAIGGVARAQATLATDGYSLLRVVACMTPPTPGIHQRKTLVDA